MTDYPGLLLLCSAPLRRSERALRDAAPAAPGLYPIRILVPREHALYGQHLLRLSAEDRRLRFIISPDDKAIEAYVGKLASRRDYVLAHFDDDLAIVGAVHIAFCGKVVELGISVDATRRKHGLGHALFSRAVVFARNRGARSAHITCLAENGEMRGLARRAGMEEVMVAAGEGEGALALPAATALTMASEALAERAGLCDYGIKSSRQAAHLIPGTAVRKK